MWGKGKQQQQTIPEYRNWGKALACEVKFIMWGKVN